MRILHAADLHLDSAFAALPAEKARQRRRESRELLTQLTQLARQNEVDAVLLAGDLFDGAHVYPETISRLKTALAQMECPVFIAPGNHDPYTRTSPYAQESWSENVHIFNCEQITAVECDGFTVHGAAFTDVHRVSEPLAEYTAPRDGAMHLLCLHGAVEETESVYGNVSRAQIARSGFAYLALGHIHQFSGAQQCGGSVWAYSGCTEGRGFDECGEKGAVIAQIETGRVQLQFMPLARHCYRIFREDVSERSPAEILEGLVPYAEDICRVIFTGESEGIDLRALTADFAAQFYALQLRDETRLPEILWSRAGEDSLRGIFLRELRARYDGAADETEKETILAAVRYGLAALDGRDLG